ncbi:Hypothetical protein Minf_0831 [Methylacidiphilum infernorum V4]|uniref:Uncharacterized protein n=1 Tax=Methylacidiphilum infernorum (isolate V4) TaxID=481448 RepID=B3E190_METI4|nr:Hypothetical protein Minf_0831 [Methylacidiphilum infernorum V4]
MGRGVIEVTGSYFILLRGKRKSVGKVISWK